MVLRSAKLYILGISWPLHTSSEVHETRISASHSACLRDLSSSLPCVEKARPQSQSPPNILSDMSAKPSTGVRFYIPDTLRNWPWPRRLNPHYAVCKAESAAWCESFKAFSPKAQNAFNRCDFSKQPFLRQTTHIDHLPLFTDLLASLAFPRLDKGDFFPHPRLWSCSSIIRWMSYRL